MEKNSRLYVAGAETLIGTALLNHLAQQGYTNVIHDRGLDLTVAEQVERLFAQTQPEYVFLTAGKSGGIQANQKYPAALMRDNLLSECHLIHSAYQHQVKKLLYLASSCSYPKHAPQPMRVESLLTGKLESTNEAYALAKIAGIGLCQAYRQQYGANFICGIPANAFGLGDDFSLNDSHVIAALIRKIFEAKMNRASTVEIWGTGKARREFIFATDLAEACVFVMQHYELAEPINLGGGEDVSIAELAQLIKEIIGYEGDLKFDPSRPDGMPLKALDATVLLALGWQTKTPLREAIHQTYRWFEAHYTELTQ